MADAEELPVFQLTELVDELARSSDDEGDGATAAAQPAPAEVASSAGPSGDRSHGERAASAFWRCAQEAGFTALCEALTFSGLRDELPRLSNQGLTFIAPTNEAFAQLAESVRTDGRLVRQLLLGHMCAGAAPLADLNSKNCAVAVAGQTHAVYEEGGHTYVGTGRFSRTDLMFDGGVIHEVTSVLMVLSLVRDSHSEQVWKKSLQPSPILSALGGVANTGAEYEVHGCLLHAATGQLIPEALRGHVRAIKPIDEEQRLAFTEITVLTKPPSLAKRRGVGTVDGSNRYRLLFSIWNTSSLNYISWQHMATPLVVRNSFHMLPIEEKNYRRTQYARARGHAKTSGGSSGNLETLPTLDEGELWQAAQPETLPPTGPSVGMMPSPGVPTMEESGAPDVSAGPAGDDTPAEDAMQVSATAGGMREWQPLSEAAGLPGAAPPLPSRARMSSGGSSNDDEASQDHCSAVNSIGNETRESIGNEPVWLAHAMREPQEEYAQLQAMAQHANSKGEEAARKAAAAAAAATGRFDSTMPPTAPPMLTGRMSSTGSLLSDVGSHAPRLLDSSCREGSSTGGTPVWLHGENFSHDLHVRFGGVAALAVNIISHNLIKCQAPAFAPLASQAREEVAITLVVASTNAAVPGTIPFAYVTGGPSSSSEPAAISPLVPPELLRRLLASLERAQAAAAAAVASAASASEYSPDGFGASLDQSISAELGLSAFSAMDEHGFSLAEYAHELSVSLGGDRNYAESSELLSQHQDLAAMMKRERLSASLAKRPSRELLHQRNILPDEQQATQRRQTLLHSLANRPAMEQLQERNILHNPDEAEETKAKRKRLESFLAERPNPDQIQSALAPPPSFSNGSPGIS